jgi:hypothetical protein
MSYSRDKNIDKSKKAEHLNFLSDCYAKRYNGSIQEVVKNSELYYN